MELRRVFSNQTLPARLNLGASNTDELKAWLKSAMAWTTEAPGRTVPSSDVAPETITGHEERTGSAMPAEGEEHPKPRRSQEPPYNVLDALLDVIVGGGDGATADGGSGLPYGLLVCWRWRNGR